MALTTDKIKVGDKFYNPHIYLETCKEFGLLTCTKVVVKPTRYLINPVEPFCPIPKPKYETRNTLIVHYVNQRGEKGEIHYWEDEFKPTFAESQEEVIDNICKERLSLCYSHLRTEIRKEYGDIFSLTNRLSNTSDKIQAKKILNLLDNLRVEIVNAKM